MEVYTQIAKSIMDSGLDHTQQPKSEQLIRAADKAAILSKEKSELLYAMILHYHSLTSSSSDSMPYGTKMISTEGGIRIPWMSMPPTLQNLALRFVEMA